MAQFIYRNTFNSSHLRTTMAEEPNVWDHREPDKR